MLGGQTLPVIRLLIMDVDGTMTDGKIHLSSSGEETKAFNAKDGFAIKVILQELDIVPVIITGRKSEIVAKRAEELGVAELYQGITNKLDIYESLKIKYKISDENIACIGDDYNDVPILLRAFHSACPKDASPHLHKICKYVTGKNGGEGAVQEFILELYKVVTGIEYCTGCVV